MPLSEVGKSKEASQYPIGLPKEGFKRRVLFFEINPKFTWPSVGYYDALRRCNFERTKTVVKHSKVFKRATILENLPYKHTDTQKKFTNSLYICLFILKNYE